MLTTMEFDRVILLFTKAQLALPPTVLSRGMQLKKTPGPATSLSPYVPTLVLATFAPEAAPVYASSRRVWPDASPLLRIC